MRCLLARTPREIALAFVKLYRAQLPAPEEIPTREVAIRDTRAMSRAESHETRKPREPTARQRPSRSATSGSRRVKQDARSRGAMENGFWFKITVGRERNADPKWLLPEICRQGEITKPDVGAIRVYDTETRFEVSPEVAERFASPGRGRARKAASASFPRPTGNHRLQAPHPHSPTRVSGMENLRARANKNATNHRMDRPIRRNGRRSGGAARECAVSTSCATSGHQ